MTIQKDLYSDALQPEKYGHKLRVAVKWRDVYIENTSCNTGGWSYSAGNSSIEGS